MVLTPRFLRMMWAHHSSVLAAPIATVASVPESLSSTQQAFNTFFTKGLKVFVKFMQIGDGIPFSAPGSTLRGLQKHRIREKVADRRHRGHVGQDAQRVPGFPPSVHKAWTTSSSERAEPGTPLRSDQGLHSAAGQRGGPGSVSPAPVRADGQRQGFPGPWRCGQQMRRHAGACAAKARISQARTVPPRTRSR